MVGQIRYEVRATSTTSRGEGEEGLRLVTFTPVNKPSDRAFDPEWKDIQISVKPDAIKRPIQRSRLHVCGDLCAQSRELTISASECSTRARHEGGAHRYAATT